MGNKGKTGKANKLAAPLCVTTTAPKKTGSKKLVFAGSNKANCAGKGTPVKNEKACQAAAKAMKRQYGGSSTTKYATFPKGCFGYQKKFYYNAGKTGKGKAGASPVCVQVTGGATKKPTGKKLVLAAKGTKNCVGKGTPVQGFNGCKAAAKALKKQFIAKGTAVIPKGCIFVNNKVQYNALNGKANRNAQPVCVQQA